MNKTPRNKLLRNIPNPDTIHNRLTAIYQEAAILRRLLRLAEQKAKVEKATVPRAR